MTSTTPTTSEPAPDDVEAGDAEASPAELSADAAPAAGDGTRRRLRWLALQPQFALPAITLLLVVYLSFSNEFFLTEQNLLNITEGMAVVGIAAAFATIVLISRGIDLSPVVAFIIAGLVCHWALARGIPVPVTVLMGVGAGAAIGLINGVLVSTLNLNPFIVTLGTNFFFTGIAFVATNGNALVIENDDFRSIGTSDLIGNVPTITVAMAAAFVLAFCILRYTRFGVHVFAVGGDTDAARLSGVPVVRVRILVYVLAGLAAGVAGVFLASASGSVAPFQASGQNDLLLILSAAIIGGTSLEGGRGTVIGTLVGILLLGIINNGLVLENISSFWQPVIVGAILIVAIILDELRRRAALRTVS